MKRMIFLISLLLLAQHLFAQEEKLRVAVFDPTSSGAAIDEGSKVAVRELVSSTFVNTGKYNIVERSLIEKVMKEQEFSNSGVVDDTQATEIGKLAGAHKVVISVISQVGGRNMLSIKVIDVKTATIDQQKTKIVHANDLLDAVEPLTLELLGMPVIVKPPTSPNSGTVKEKTPDVKPVVPSPPNTASEGDIVLYFAGFSSNKNLVARIFVDGTLVGNGTLSQGFSVSFPESRAGIYKVRIEWSSIGTKTYDLDTRVKKRFEFEYVRGGFGYEFRLKK
ncbi:MAG: CsgG/HfaB family protein [Prevotellaceae bacterium]|jgi:hypothetical protein|nr:CsgG/HfaB family protein [Prevotellaceae bacterium]